MANGVVDMGGRRGQISDSDWCIVRTSAAGTIAVHAALADAGIEAWTPIGLERKLVGKTRKPVQRRVALLPTFAFARYGALPELLRLSRSPSPSYQCWDPDEKRMVMRGCPTFSIFRHGSIYPAVTDRELDRLRVIEQKGRPVAAVRMIEAGEAVRYPDAGFDGLTGVVQTVKGRWAFVLFEGFGQSAKVDRTRLLSAA